MITIEVTAYDGQPPPRALISEFDEMGGTIGRAEGNTLVLPDPKRYISRTHASVMFRGEGYVLRDVGSASPVVINGKQLGAGREAPIHDGDVVTIANYTMRVVASRADSPVGAATPVIAAASGPVKDDPLAAFGAQPSSANPFADLMPTPASTPAPPSTPAVGEKGAGKRTNAAPRSNSIKPAPAATLPPESASFAIPEDFDPFAEPISSPRHSAAKEGDVFDFGPAAREQKIDDIFGLSALHGNDPIAGPLAAPQDKAADAEPLDPMVAIGAARPRKETAYAAQRDDAPEIHGSFRMPSTASQAAPPAYEDADESRAAAPSTPRPAGSALTDALLKEFLAGAGITQLQIQGGLTPELMHVIGHLFRESIQGTLDLLLARMTAKRELRSTLTTIVARDNNPLKFSPSVEAAMAHLLAPQPGGGFMPPVPALKDAYDDLRAHEFGFMAGMRAALAGVLARFDPARLERRLAQKSMLDTLLPINRQAKLWALFGELYADISREAEDNFHNVFGAEFLKAYEEQIAKLEKLTKAKE